MSGQASARRGSGAGRCGRCGSVIATEWLHRRCLDCHLLELAALTYTDPVLERRLREAQDDGPRFGELLRNALDRRENASAN